MLCQAAAPDTASWQQLRIGPHFVVGAPADLRPDTSVNQQLLFFHGGAQWGDRQLTVYWDVSNAAYAGTLHDSLKARLTRPDEWSSLRGCEAPSASGWLIRSAIGKDHGRYKAGVWMVKENGSQDLIYHLDLEARTDSAFVTALAIVRSLRLSSQGGNQGIAP
jgi:hypothetical protein